MTTYMELFNELIKQVGDEQSRQSCFVTADEDRSIILHTTDTPNTIKDCLKALVTQRVGQIYESNGYKHNEAAFKAELEISTAIREWLADYEN